MKQNGFTLIELVAAMAIFAMLSVMAYGGLVALINTRDGLDSSYQRMQAWQMTVHRLRTDLTQARQRPIRDEFGDYQAALHEPEEGRLEFTHGGRRNPLVQARSSLERVAWFLDTDGTLVRQNWLNLDRGQSEVPLKTVMLKGIEELQWRYLDSSDEWVEDWPPASLASTQAIDITLPRAVELTLESKRLGELRFLFALASDQ
ncbi:MAG: type II secretion system minor pseudopilin GspJ [Oceanococcus sp.]